MNVEKAKIELLSRRPFRASGDKPETQGKPGQTPGYGLKRGQVRDRSNIATDNSLWHSLGDAFTEGVSRLLLTFADR